MSENPYQSPAAESSATPPSFRLRWNHGWAYLGKWVGLLLLAVSGVNLAIAMWELTYGDRSKHAEYGWVAVVCLFSIQFGGVCWAGFGALWEVLDAAIREHYRRE